MQGRPCRRSAAGHPHHAWLASAGGKKRRAPNAAVSLLQDGTIKYEIKLTGELSTNLPNPEEGELPQYGTMVLPGVNAQHHQHMFCARLDMAVDDAEGGRGLLVTEVGSCKDPPT